MPNYSTALIGERLGYVRRGGAHDISGHDWKLHGVCTIEFLRLQLNEYVTLQNTVVEHEVDPLVGVIDQNLLLTRLEAEPRPHFKDKLL